MLRESHRPGIEPATCKSQVQRPTAEPPRNIRVGASHDMGNQPTPALYMKKVHPLEYKAQQNETH